MAMICYECELPGECSHWTEDDGATQSCPFPVDDGAAVCQCEKTTSRERLNCSWCGEGVDDRHEAECRIVLDKEADLLRVQLADNERTFGMFRKQRDDAKVLLARIEQECSVSDYCAELLMQPRRVLS